MGRVLLILLISFVCESARANSCCGQSPASFTVLALEQRVHLTTSYSLIQSQGRVFGSDEFYVWEDKEREIRSLQLNLAGAIAHRQQLFLTTSLLEGRYSDAYENGTSQHLSDTQLGYTYEVLPEYSFSYWKPVIYLSAIVNLPTGRSIYEPSKLSEGAGVTGHNQWGAGVGLTVRKVYFPLTLTFQAKSIKMFSKRFDAVQVSDFYDNSFALLGNYATGFQEITANFGVTVSQLTERRIEPAFTTSGIMQNTTLLLGLQRPFGEEWSGGLSYSDQTLIGRARNTILNRSYTLNLSYNYF